MDYHPTDDKVLNVMEPKIARFTSRSISSRLEPMFEAKRMWDSQTVKISPELIACVRAGARERLAFDRAET